VGNEFRSLTGSGFVVGHRPTSFGASRFSNKSVLSSTLTVSKRQQPKNLMKCRVDGHSSVHGRATISVAARVQSG
jgi:hypothetical protein